MNFVKVHLPVEEHLKFYSIMEISPIVGESNKCSNLNTATESFLSLSIVGMHTVSNDDLLHK